MHFLVTLVRKVLHFRDKQGEEGKGPGSWEHSFVSNPSFARGSMGYYINPATRHFLPLLSPTAFYREGFIFPAIYIKYY